MILVPAQVCVVFRDEVLRHRDAVAKVAFHNGLRPRLVNVPVEELLSISLADFHQGLRVAGPDAAGFHHVAGKAAARDVRGQRLENAARS